MKLAMVFGVMLVGNVALAAGVVGDLCTKDKDCKSHVCLDLGGAESVCAGIKTCAVACNEKTNSVCNNVLPDGTTEKGDCDPVARNGGKSDYCLYTSMMKHCPKLKKF